MLVTLFSLALSIGPTNESCEALCIRDGFTSGKAHKSGCVCLSVKENFEDFARGRIRLNREPVKVLVEHEPPPDEEF